MLRATISGDTVHFRPALCATLRASFWAFVLVPWSACYELLIWKGSVNFSDTSFLYMQQLRRSSANVQFPWYCKPGRLSVIYVHVGPGWVKTNRFSYTGAVQRNADVKFMTEQDGGGQILAKFNGAILNCQGFSALKRKTCTIPRALRPWSGTITVEIGRHPSTRFQMSGTPGML